MPAQNDRGYCTPNHCVVGREQERNTGRKRGQTSVTVVKQKEKGREKKTVREALQGP